MRDEFGMWARGTTFLNPNYQLRKMPGVVESAIIAAFGGTGAAIASYTLAGVTTTIYVSTVAAYAIYTAGTMWALSKLLPKVPSPTSPDLSNRLQPDSPKQVIYGQTRVGGAITYIESVDNSSNLLQVICIAGHPVEEIGDIFLNDDKITAANVGSGSVNGGSVNDANWKKGSSIKVKVYKGNGSNNTTALATLYSRTANTTEVNSTDFTGNDTSFLYTDFEYNKDVFRDGIPTVNAVVKGRKVYDPRKDSTSDAYNSSFGVSTHRKTNSSTWQYSNNPALCILDYITQDHGLNASWYEIDDQEWANEADLCEDSITLADNTTQYRYELNGVFTRDMAPKEVIPAMLSSCGGSLFYAQGRWVLRIGIYRTPISPVFDESDLRGALSVDTKTSRRDLFNSVTGQVSSPDEDWVPTDYPMITSSTFETEDGGERNTLELPLPFTTDMAMAQRLAKQTLYRAREQLIVSAKFGLKAFEARVGDNIRLTNSRMGWNQKVFEVISWRFSHGENAALEVEVTLKENSSSVYSWNAEESAFSGNNTTLPSFNFAPQPSFDGNPTTEVIIQEDGTAVVSAEVAWTVSDDAYVNDYIIEWKRTTETYYQSIITTNLYYRIPNVQIGSQYNFRISSRNKLGIQSAVSTSTVTISGDQTGPSAPSIVSVTGGINIITIDWTNPTDNDFYKVEVYSNTSNQTIGATKIGETAGSFFIDSGLGDNATRYYFLKAYDYTGNASAFTGTANNSATTQDEFTDGENPVGITVSNEAHVFPANNSGAITSYIGSGATIQVFRGSTALTATTAAGTLSENNFRVTASGTNITPSTSITASGNSIIFGDHSAMIADQASITYTITVRNEANDGNETYTKTQSFSKSKAGATGVTGQSGLSITLNGAEIQTNNVNPQTATQAQLDSAFLAANPLLAQMSDIPEDAIVWARFKNPTLTAASSLVSGTRYVIEQIGTSDFTGVGAARNLVGIEFTATGTTTGTGQVTTASTRQWDYSTQNWSAHADTFDAPAVFSPTVFALETLSQFIAATEIVSDKLRVNSEVNLEDGAAWRVGKQSWDQQVNGIFLGNPTGNLDFAFSTFGQDSGGNDHGVSFSDTETRISNPVIVKDAVGSVSSGNITTSGNITIKSASLNPNATSITINAMGGGAGGAASVQTVSPTNGGRTRYRLVLDGVNQSYINASGGIADTGTGSDKWRGDDGQASAFASGGAGGGSENDSGDNGTLGSGGGGGAGNPPDWNQSSVKGGAGGGAGQHLTHVTDISSYSTVTLEISEIGNIYNSSNGVGGVGSRGNGGQGGDGLIRYTIETDGAEPVILNTQPDYNSMFDATDGKFNHQSGFQLRFGSFSSATDGDQTVYFGEDFTTQCLGVLCSIGGATSLDASNSINKDRFVFNRMDAFDGTYTVFYIAFGY